MLHRNGARSMTLRRRSVRKLLSSLFSDTRSRMRPAFVGTPFASQNCVAVRRDGIAYAPIKSRTPGASCRSSCRCSPRSNAVAVGGGGTPRAQECLVRDAIGSLPAIVAERISPRATTATQADTRKRYWLWLGRCESPDCGSPSCCPSSPTPWSREKPRWRDSTASPWSPPIPRRHRSVGSRAGKFGLQRQRYARTLIDRPLGVELHRNIGATDHFRHDARGLEARRPTRAAAPDPAQITTVSTASVCGVPSTTMCRPLSSIPIHVLDARQHLHAAAAGSSVRRDPARVFA